MLTETVQNLLNRRKQEKNVIRVPRSTKSHNAFVMERYNEKSQYELRNVALVQKVEELNQIVKDQTFRFVIWDYGNFYSIQVFEGDRKDNQPCVIIGNRNDKMFESIPMYRKHFKTLNGIKAYIVWYFNNYIKPEHELLKRLNPRFSNTGIELAYEMRIVEVQNAQFKPSRAVIFTIEMMMEWQKSKLLPTIQSLYNGKRFNRTVHGKKVIAALEQGKIVKEDNNYIVYWTL
jgi:hypothetical protein